MNGYSISLASGRYGVPELSVLIRPRRIDPTRCAILYAHGANGDATSVAGSVQASTTRHAAAWARAGYVVLAGDWGGPFTFGNDAELAAMDAGWEWLRASGLCRPDKVLLAGGSMGMLSVSRWAADNEAEVAGINAWIPAIDLEDVRNRNALGLRDQVNAAWGLPAGSYVGAGGAPIPARGRVLDRAAEVAAIPTHLWYSTADTAAVPAAVITYLAARTGAIGHVVSAVLDHVDAAIAAVDNDAVVAFYDSVARA